MQNQVINITGKQNAATLIAKAKEFCRAENRDPAPIVHEMVHADDYEKLLAIFHREFGINISMYVMET